MISSLAMGTSFSGMLPPPEILNSYDAATQERMMRWNDSFTIDESARQDRLVEAEIEQARKGPTRSMFITVVSMTLAAICIFGYDNTVAAGLFLGGPLLMYAGSLIRDVGSRSSKDRRP